MELELDLDSFFEKFDSSDELWRWAEDVDRYGEGIIRIDVDDLVNEGFRAEEAWNALLELAQILRNETNAQWG